MQEQPALRDVPLPAGSPRRGAAEVPDALLLPRRLLPDPFSAEWPS
jgi:hypothetical protein